MIDAVIDLQAADPTRPADQLALGHGCDGFALDALSTALIPLTVRETLLTWDPSPAVGEVEVLTLPGLVPSRVLAAGIGRGTDRELRMAGAAVARAATGDTVTVALPSSSAMVEGLALGAYRFERKSTTAPGLLRAELVDVDESHLHRGRILAGAVCWARDLTNTPATVKTPEWLGAQAVDVLTPLGVDVEARDEAWLLAEGFGGVLAVGRGSAVPPRLIEARWRPRGASGHIVLVGKGITFDTGGLNIKPGSGMRLMHTDMGGGAAVLATVRAVAELGVPIKVTALVPTAQNSVSGSSMRPSDVIRHFGGRTSEVLNTDAEGRLVLADALAYAVARLSPDVLIDIATLTGAAKVALGLRTAGLFTADDSLAQALTQAGDTSDELVWRLPLLEEYAPLINSDVADANNAAGNPGATTAALFLRPFAGDVPWVHLDIAGPARAPETDGLLTQGATGFGARLLTQWLIGRAQPAKTDT
jgi:leucyl aminopeptidase